MPGLDWGTILMQYARAIGWSITAAVGFAFGIGIALKVFDMLSTDIDEWEEIKKGNMGVSLIFISLIIHLPILHQVRMNYISNQSRATGETYVRYSQEI